MVDPEAVHEVNVYIHRFHNLDLFDQGWYQLKISMRWEDDDTCSPGSPSRLVQYQGPLSFFLVFISTPQRLRHVTFLASELGCDDIVGAWRIDDMDRSFSSQPFHIRYARQDIFLCVMITFNLSLAKYMGPISSPVVLKYELLFASVLKDRFNLQSSWIAGPAAVHEFRISPKALLGLHSYCPVYFDAFHSVLVDTSVHISLLEIRSGSIDTPSDPYGQEEIVNEKYNKTNQVVFVKALSTSHAILLEELESLSNISNQTIDLTGFSPEQNETKLFFVSRKADITEPSQVPEKNDSEDELSRLLHSLGDQVFYLWKTYLKFHRENKTRILERLHDDWANDRRAEWSIWIVSSKVEVHHGHVGSQGGDYFNAVHEKARAFQKIIENPAEATAMRAELHRHSIAQMKMNSRSIQDLQIFGDPSRLPIIIIERVVNAPFHSTSGNSDLCNTDKIDSHRVLSNFGSCFSHNRQKGGVLKIAVFVHGFQGHHLDLRLVRNQWLLIDPKMEIMMSRINEDNTTGDFREMGLRLAQEVISFIKKKKEKSFRTRGVTKIKLSFVGHSIGNIIIRTALTESIMEPYHKFLDTYVSLSGPHLGYLYSANSLFNSGLWLLKKLKNTQCIHQLTFTDDIDLHNTFIYKLCKQKTLENFKNIILLSSPQDGYVPYHSARIEMCQASSSDYSKTGQVFLEMLNNCLEQIRAPSTEQRMLMRCDVNFDVSLQSKNLNTLIGRAAHIDFLETDTFIKFIMWSFPEFF